MMRGYFHGIVLNIVLWDLTTQPPTKLKTLEPRTGKLKRDLDDYPSVVVACSPKVDPCVMRVQRPARARRTFDARQEAHAGQAAGAGRGDSEGGRGSAQSPGKHNDVYPTRTLITPGTEIGGRSA